MKVVIGFWGTLIVSVATSNAESETGENQFDGKNRIVRLVRAPYPFLAMTTNAILARDVLETMPKPQPTSLEPAEVANDRYWKAVVERDSSHDGQFFFAVSSTGVYCRPSCAARRPRRENVRFFSTSGAAEQAGYRACLRCRPRAFTGNAESNWAKGVCRFIEQHLDEPMTLGRLAEEFRQNPFRLQRRFKAVLGITPREFADSCRLKTLKRNLQAGDSVTRAMYDAGYGSSSRLYEKTASQLGMTPDKYRRGAIAATIRYTCADSPLGRMLIAATDRGVCAIQFARTDSELTEGLKREFPFAVRKVDNGGLRSWVNALLRHLRGKDSHPSLPLDIRATAFQRRVWAYLQSIPFGETKSYSDVAKAIGEPKACRAVARACATNPVAVAIPCHRVVREDGARGGYRWGLERKEALLKMERATVDR